MSSSALHKQISPKVASVCYLHFIIYLNHISVWPHLSLCLVANGTPMPLNVMINLKSLSNLISPWHWYWYYWAFNSFVNTLLPQLFDTILSSHPSSLSFLSLLCDNPPCDFFSWLPTVRDSPSFVIGPLLNCISLASFNHHQYEDGQQTSISTHVFILYFTTSTWLWHFRCVFQSPPHPLSPLKPGFYSVFPILMSVKHVFSVV